ncbi:TRAP transporter small permease [Salibacterium aidingense]|uniref:TRAP transporter small permease n=1 Tax=Salibacterium aidingense TaxID=384933 RepID=UPI000423475C|nr:TRAP transporter small permease [Salibacterium aidingense]
MNNQTMMARLQKADHILALSIKIICVTLLAVIVLSISASIFTRFVVFSPLNFANALSKYLMMWMAFLGAGLAIREGEHIVVDILLRKLKGKNRTRLLLFINTLVSVFLLLIVYYGYLYALSGIDSSDPFVFGINMMIPYLSVPVGALYMLIQLNITTLLQLWGEQHHEQRGGV